MTEDKELLALLQLHLTPGIGGNTIKQLIRLAGSASEAWKLPERDLLSIKGLGKARIEGLISSKSWDPAKKVWEDSQRTQVNITHIMDDQFPVRLRNLSDAPVILFYRGSPVFSSPKIVSVIGSRKATEYGKMASEKIIRELAPYQPIIVSGMAFGIDISAHRAALKYGLETWGILAGGVNKLYPPEHGPTAKQMLDQGALLSEYPPETKAEPGQFPARNRIIAGLSDAVVVVEANQKGGALITADIANSYDREVFAVPGNINRPTSAGCNRLIRNHEAHIVSNIRDITETLGWTQSKTKLGDIRIEELSGDEKLIYELLLEKKELPLDLLRHLSGFSGNHLSSLLLNLEFSGYVKPLPGNRFRPAA